ncbi:hypothetical protein Tco_0752708 [Tanacetum coccineum]|uniref:Uncharacterized protein n=1 Tax=Tanacetum coccineum TaxID=301880 RepID=A0ABQ4ZAH1_9ASTR
MELIGNLIDTMRLIIKKDSEIVKSKVVRKSLALKDKGMSQSEAECSTFGSEDAEVRLGGNETSGSSLREDGRLSQFIYGECPKPPRDKKTKSIGLEVRGSLAVKWNDEKIQGRDLVSAQNEVCFESSYFLVMKTHQLMI